LEQRVTILALGGILSHGRAAFGTIQRAGFHGRK
jgi:hypothetical protein